MNHQSYTQFHSLRCRPTCRSITILCGLYMFLLLSNGPSPVTATSYLLEYNKRVSGVIISSRINCRISSSNGLCVRGGDSDEEAEQEKRELDEYIEQLLASVDDESMIQVVEDAPNEHIPEENADEGVAEAMNYDEKGNKEVNKEVVEASNKDKEGNSDDSITAVQEVDQGRNTECEDEHHADAPQVHEQCDDDGDKASDKEADSLGLNDDDSNNTENNRPDESFSPTASFNNDEAAARSITTKSKRKYKKLKKQSQSALASNNSKEQLQKSSRTGKEESTNTVTAPTTAESSLPVIHRRPNAAYRFLLGKGRIGHVIVMICVLAVEWMQAYIPMLLTMLAWIRLQLFGPPSDAYDMESNGRSSGMGISDKVNAQYTGFVSTDGTTGRGNSKQKQALAKMADQAAAARLRQVGSIRDAKYRHLSVNFMKRYGLGPFQDMSLISSVVGVEMNEHAEGTLIESSSTSAATEEESDVDWVVQALTAEDDDATQTNTNKRKGRDDNFIKPSLSAKAGSSGASMSVGFEMGFGSSNKHRKKQSYQGHRRASVLDAATRTATQKREQVKKPRVSDREGGGGVMGRIRAASANSLVARSITGAYPRDAVAPSEAGSPEGVIQLARKYGYGDWVDDNYDDTNTDTGTDTDDDKDNEPSKERQKKSHTIRNGTTNSHNIDNNSNDNNTNDNNTRKQPPLIRRKKVKKTSRVGSSSRKRRKRSPSLSVGFELNNKMGFDASSGSHTTPTFPQNRPISRATSSFAEKRTQGSASVSATKPKFKESDVLKPRKDIVGKKLAADKLVRLPTQRIKEKNRQAKLQRDKQD